MRRLACLLALYLPALARAEVGLLPPLEIAAGLPSHAHCKAAAAVSAKYRNDFERAVREVGGEAWIVAQGARDAAWTWGRCQVATDPTLSDEVRRQALKELIDWFGWRAVLTADLPPPVPAPP